MSIEAMKQAIDALESITDYDKLHAARVALRTAIQQAESEPVLTVEKEPDYWSGGHFHKGYRPHIDPTKVWGLPIGTKLYTTPRPAQATQAEVTGLLEVFDDAVSQELLRVSHVEYDSHEICKHFASKVRAILALRPVQVPMTDEVRERALDLLATLFDAYENGPACYESPDDCDGYLGNAVQIDHDTFHVIANLLNTHRPIIPAQAKKEAP